MSSALPCDLYLRRYINAFWVHFSPVEWNELNDPQTPKLMRSSFTVIYFFNMRSYFSSVSLNTPTHVICIIADSFGGQKAGTIPKIGSVEQRLDFESQRNKNAYELVDTFCRTCWHPNAFRIQQSILCNSLNVLDRSSLSN